MKIYHDSCFFHNWTNSFPKGSRPKPTFKKNRTKCAVEQAFNLLSLLAVNILQKHTFFGLKRLNVQFFLKLGFWHWGPWEKYWFNWETCKLISRIFIDFVSYFGPAWYKMIKQCSHKSPFCREMFCKLIFFLSKITQRKLSIGTKNFYVYKDAVANIIQNFILEMQKILRWKIESFSQHVHSHSF